MAEMEKMDDLKMEEVAGGTFLEGWATVSGLRAGFLALRTKPGYDRENEIIGSESYNGDLLRITGGVEIEQRGHGRADHDDDGIDGHKGALFHRGLLTIGFFHSITQSVLK